MRAAGRGRGRGGACLHAGAGGAAAAAVQRAAIDAGRGAAGGAGRALRLSPPRGRVRAVVACRLSAVRRAGVSPRTRAPGGGGEPRAARPRAHAPAAPARSASAPPRPPPPRPRRRARSLAAGSQPPPLERPKLRPVFLWARQLDGTVQEVRCEDYDPRNRIRIARTATGWRAIPRTEIYNSIRLPPPPRRDRKERRRRGRPRKREAVEPEPLPLPSAWLARDLESHIPSHTIAVPRAEPPEPPEPSPRAQLAPPHAEPTPLDNLLAVAELEFNQQRGEELELELQATAGAQYAFLPDEEVARDVMSFELGEAKTDGMFFDRKSHAPERAAEDDGFQNDMVVHKDLFETISEAHYLPELGGPHDEALLESLVEKGCEDNQILGQALDKFAHLVHASGDYGEEEEDILLSGAPVADIIDRLEQSLESPGRNSITAAQGLLHLHHIGDHLNTTDHQQSDDQSYISDDVFDPQTSTESNIETLNSQSDIQERNTIHLEYEHQSDKRLQSEDEENTGVIYAESVPDKRRVYENNVCDEQHPQILPDQSGMVIITKTSNEEKMNTINCKQITSKSNNVGTDEDHLSIIPTELEYSKKRMKKPKSNNLIPTDLSVRHLENTALIIESAAEINNHTEDSSLSDKSDDQPKDLSVHRRLPTPHASPKRIDIPRAPSRESDAMQSPQPSGIPAVPSSPEQFTMPPAKSKQTVFLETLLTSTSPKMYTSEVTITKQQCEPLNLGKHRKSASPTVSSCSDEIRKVNKEYGEPHEKKLKNDLTETKASKSNEEAKSKKPERKSGRLIDDVHPVKQLKALHTLEGFKLPDPLLIPKERLNQIVAAPLKEIPALLAERPELRIPQVFHHPTILHDPNILVISVKDLECILTEETRNLRPAVKIKEKDAPPTPAPTPSITEQRSNTPQPDQTNSNSTPRPTPSMDALAGDIDAATSAAINPMLWLPYMQQQLEALAACSQNRDVLKALNSGYPASNYELAQMIGASARFMGPTGFPIMSQMDFDNQMSLAMWQDAMNQSNANASASQRSKSNSTLEAQLMEMASKASDVQNPYVHSTKNSQNKSHTSARTSPITPNYNNSQRSTAHSPYLQSMYPGMNPNIRPNMQMPFSVSPYFNPNMMSQRSPRMGQQKSPNAPFYPNNNYLQSVKHSEGHSHQRSNSTSSQGSPRPRISVRSLQNLLEPTATAVSGAASSSRRSSSSSAASGRRRDEPEVGSTTALEEPPSQMPPHPNDPSSFHLWHPLFSNQKSYNSPWSWTTVSATGD